MNSLQKVALLGKGKLGSAVLDQLVASGFSVTVLSRSPSDLKNLPFGVNIAQVDYSSHLSLVAALRGHDVAIATLGFAAIPIQKTIINASIEAGVKRYVPSDWGSITTDPSARQFPVNYPFVEIQDFLKDRANEGKLEYTIFSVGAWLDSVIDSQFIFDIGTRSIQLYDRGEHPFSSTSLSGIGKAVSGALNAPEATRNRNLFIHETVLTQAMIFEMAKKYSPPGTEWTVTGLDAGKELDESLRGLEKDPKDYKLIYRLLKAALLSGTYRAAYEKVDNEIVGVPIFTDEEIGAVFAPTFQQ
ncbi:hypothetical protein J3E69DRAFT_377688 [Trichoderma sp. SZMC 28015]